MHSHALIAVPSALVPAAFACATTFLPVLAVFGVASAAGASYQSGYAHFGSVSDTIQVLGNTHFGASYGAPRPGYGDFTYEMNIRISEGAGMGHIISEQRDTWEDKTMVLGAGGEYAFSGLSDDPTGTVHGSISGFRSDQWMHLAYVKYGSAVTIYVDGRAVASHTAAFQYPDHDGSWMSIGMFRYGAGYIPTSARPSFLGDLDWLRVSAGAKYTSNFVAPTESEISADASTQLLLRFNEAAGTSVLIDESANRFTCNMGVAVYPGVVATAPALMYGAVPAPGALAMLGAGAVFGLSRRRRCGM